MSNEAINLASLDGTNGFKINDMTLMILVVCLSSSAGDVNGDGIDDIIIGAYYADPDGRTNDGES